MADKPSRSGPRWVEPITAVAAVAGAVLAFDQLRLDHAAPMRG